MSCFLLTICDCMLTNISRWIVAPFVSSHAKHAVANGHVAAVVRWSSVTAGLNMRNFRLFRFAKKSDMNIVCPQHLLAYNNQFVQRTRHRHSMLLMQTYIVWIVRSHWPVIVSFVLIGEPVLILKVVISNMSLEASLLAYAILRCFLLAWLTCTPSRLLAQPPEGHFNQSPAGGAVCSHLFLLQEPWSGRGALVTHLCCRLDWSRHPYCCEDLACSL